MEEINYELMSNKELTEKYDELNEKFENAQANLRENYLAMVSYSEEGVKIKEILTKRGVK